MPRAFCAGWGQRIVIPTGVGRGESFDCPNWAGLTLRASERDGGWSVIEVKKASCAVGEEWVILPEKVRPGDIIECHGVRQRVTYEFGAYALERIVDWSAQKNLPFLQDSTRGGCHGRDPRDPVHSHGHDLRGMRKGSETSLGEACRREERIRRSNPERGARQPGGIRHLGGSDDRRHPGGREVPGKAGRVSDRPL